MQDSTLVTPGSDFWDQDLVKRLKKLNPSYHATLNRVYTFIKPIAEARPMGSEEFTDHNLAHSIRLIRRAGQILPQGVVLNGAELYILLASALLHDLGMWVSKGEAEQMRDSDKGFQEWCRRSYDEASALIDKMVKSDRHCWMAELLLQRLAATYARGAHPTRLATTVLYESGNPHGQELRALLDAAFVSPIIRVSEAHGWERSRVLSDKVLEPEEIGNDTVNLRYLAFLLRLGDLLDMGKGRVSSLLWAYLHPINAVSEAHWRKEATLDVARCTPDAIRVRGNFDTERFGLAAAESYTLAKEWLHWLDEEIALGARQLHTAAEYTEELSLKDKYFFRLLKLDTSEVVANGLVFGGQLKLELDRDRILELLGSEIYTQGYVFVRELLQNAMDATRAQIVRDWRKENNQPNAPVMPWELTQQITGQDRYVIDVTVKTVVEDGATYDVYSIQDRGIGMTVQQIRDYFLQIGKSFYQDKYKSEFAHPSISRFGIGFLSCLLSAERIEVTTRPHDEVTGLSLMLNQQMTEYTVIKNDMAAQGTTIRLWIDSAYSSQQSLPFSKENLDHPNTDGTDSKESELITATKQWGLWPEMKVLINGKVWGPHDAKTTPIFDDANILRRFTKRANKIEVGHLPFRFFNESGGLISEGKLSFSRFKQNGIPIVSSSREAGMPSGLLRISINVAIRGVWIATEERIYTNSFFVDVNYYKAPRNVLSAGRTLRGDTFTQINHKISRQLIKNALSFVYSQLNERDKKSCGLWVSLFRHYGNIVWQRQDPILFPFRTTKESGWATLSELSKRFERFLLVPPTVAIYGGWEFDIPCVGYYSHSGRRYRVDEDDDVKFGPLVRLDGLCTAVMSGRDLENLEGLTPFTGNATFLWNGVHTWNNNARRTIGNSERISGRIRTGREQFGFMKNILPDYDRNGGAWNEQSIMSLEDTLNELIYAPKITLPTNPLDLVLEEASDWM